MPTAVTCSLFAGICAVTEFHHSIDYSFLHWSEKWTFGGIDATALSFLHAIIAFALH
uniref:7TM_GPCR_Srx domain-containing protein n=1 Tax=Elaeophora elaphi TaxID=1147741 RepID=A0A0R3RZY4_9BILA